MVYPVWVFDPSDWLRFIQLRLFESEWSDMALKDDALRALEITIMAGPTLHPVVPGTRGLRKLRFAEPGSHRGKSGSYRIGYAYFPDYHTVLLVTVWGKNEKADLVKADRNAIAAVIGEVQELLDAGEI